MEIIYNKPGLYDTKDIWIQPVSRGSVLESNEVGSCTIIKDKGILESTKLKETPVLRILASPSLKKTIFNIAYVLKDKMTFFKNSKPKYMENIFKYLNKVYFDKGVNNYYKSYKAWYRVIGDLFENINVWNFKKVTGKLITILKAFNPVIVFDLHNISKWNHIKTFQRFIKWLNNEGLSIVLRCPFESVNYLKKIFEDAKTNNIAAVMHYAKKRGYLISESVSKEILKLSSGNLKIINIILSKSKRILKNLRDLKISWKHVLIEVIPKKYKKIMETITHLKKFNIKEIVEFLDYSHSTVYNYLNELVNLNVIKKRRVKKNILFKINIDKESLLNSCNYIKDPKNIFFEVNKLSKIDYKVETFNEFLVFG
ncbi:conserved hypothetical protein [Methanococcus vannielii SB]|uniref:Uncharacterized protein n=1 Tax=Methanococcus vannielii (strain ATCC 35089 / DSM 1224 / JCM 13029 / OCM 148 / SB) TaxID=406327 RepID=A6UR09_METVS|nr:DeoR family transcriptional regulator [Methanococcus vannielii]ABR54931.1 conserved hypothetical protein [Methanococcus vannielii SB]